VKVLIVDASPRVRARLAERFAEDGFDVVQANGAEDALAAVAADGTLAAIVFDLHVDGAPGIEVLAELRRAAPSAVVVVLTNETHELNRVACLRHGADFFFDKARDFDRAVEAIARFVSTTRLS
jgi:DNA-binding response OmpR family regulator